MDYEALFKHEFKSIIDKFRMKYIVLAKDQVAIVGEGFALIFTMHRGETSIRYVMPNRQGELEVYNFDLFIVGKFDANDRVGIKTAVTHEEIISNEIEVMARGLMNHWSNLLLGDKCWVEEYYAIFGIDGKPYKAHKTIVDKLEKLIC